jgi:Protein of unknown function (DUF1579)
MKVLRFAFVALAGLLALPIAAEDKKAEAPKMPSQEEMMKTWMDVAIPGKPHEMLAKSAGSWTNKVTSWMVPGKPPEVTEGTTEMTMVLGGRFLSQHSKGTMMGQPFEGMGQTGYDNYKKKYISTWMDTAGTTIMMMTGTWNEAKKSVTMTGTMDDPAFKKAVKVSSVLKMIDDDHQVYEMFSPGPDGKPMKVLEVAYTRKK